MDAEHKCGIAAVNISDSLKNHPLGGASYYLHKLLLQQQNRGQLSAGITTYNGNRPELLYTYKELGSVNKVFRMHHKTKYENIMRKYNGLMGIGHIRYATCGADDFKNVQPFEKLHGRKWKWFSFAFNGNIANFPELKKELKDKGYHLMMGSDTEALMHYMAKGLAGDKKVEIEDVFSGLADKLDGAYSIAHLNAEGELSLIRDPWGFRPLVYGKTNGLFCAASESAALTNLDINTFESLEPGHILKIKDGKIEKKRFSENKRKAHCMFEWVYFANVSSVIDDVSVYDIRYNLGGLLAKKETEKLDKDCVVVPVPDTAKPAADGFAIELGLTIKEGLIRNRYVGRTFIEGTDRAERVKDKFTLNRTVLEGKKIFLIEDSIVRGTTCKTLIQYLKEKGGAKEVHIRVSAPIIFFPCFYGIDMSTMDELIANRLLSGKDIINRMENAPMEEYDEKTVEKIRKELKADSLIYQTVDDLIKAIGKPKKDLCTACLTGDYPTEYGKVLVKKALQERGCKIRTYE
ncbi:MAG: amidophosphoribosyltransferase [Candidatus Diapherotrites archaeon CG08_land_8_20_14_0_20_34_12]|nr:MAG: amidophosphoribosyltransferase [Candidatus Diapherotrites archaeon CG08_land_8_20_14_0_20_34_12]